jgi:hypothetical protein
MSVFNAQLRACNGHENRGQVPEIFSLWGELTNMVGDAR